MIRLESGRLVSHGPAAAGLAGNLRCALDTALRVKMQNGGAGVPTPAAPFWCFCCIDDSLRLLEAGERSNPSQIDAEKGPKKAEPSKSRN
jgi:hypothetical protein